MKTLQTMRTIKPTLLIALIAFSLNCGYSKKTTPTMPGTMPTITQLTPASGAAGAAVALEVDGSNFAAKTVINFNGAVQATTFVSSSKLETTVPSTAVMNLGMVPVTVTNPAVPGGIYGGGTTAETSAAMTFTVN